MAEVIRRELVVPGEEEVVGVGGGHAVSAASKRPGSRAKAKEKPKAPTWAEALAEEKLLESLIERIGDLGLLIEAINRAARGRRPNFSRMLDAEQPHLGRCIRDSLKLYQKRLYQKRALLKPHLERCIEESLKLYQKRESLKRAAEWKTIDMEKLFPPPHHHHQKEEEMKKLSVLESLLACPESAEQFRQFLKDQRFVLFHEYLRRISEKRAPDFSGMSEADRAAEAERLRQEAFLEASRLEEGCPERRRLEAHARILDFDPKQGGIYYNSFWLQDLSTFDLGEESPIGPMRFTKEVFEDNKVEVCTAVNILSVQVACSDVGFPIQIYGTVIARDSTDFKRLYLFHRDRDHCQLINSEDEPLILTGPKRGLAMLDGNYVETDLKIRDHQGQDRELSKGIMIIKGIVGRSLEKCKIESLSLHTRLSTVKMVHAVVVSAMEATIAIEVVEGEFCRTVTAHTTSIKKRLVLYDSQVAGHKHAGGGRGPVKMMRPVVCVCVKDELIIIAKALGGKSAVFTITPKVSRGDQSEFTLGTTKMRLQVNWSIMDP